MLSNEETFQTEIIKNKVFPGRFMGIIYYQLLVVY